MNTNKVLLPRTLQGVHALLPRLYSGTSIETLQKAIMRAEKLHGRRLNQIPADEAAWANACARVVWAGHFRGRDPKKSFDAWVRQVGGCIRAATKRTPGGPEATDIGMAWDSLQAYVAQAEKTWAEGRLVLPNMSSLSIANLRARLGDVHPAQIDREAARRALVATARGNLVFPAFFLRRACAIASGSRCATLRARSFSCAVSPPYSTISATRASGRLMSGTCSRSSGDPVSMRRRT